MEREWSDFEQRECNKCDKFLFEPECPNDFGNRDRLSIVGVQFATSVVIPCPAKRRVSVAGIGRLGLELYTAGFDRLDELDAADNYDSVGDAVFLCDTSDQ